MIPRARWRRSSVFLAAAAVCLLTSASAFGYCLTRTCNPTQEHCEVDENDCIVSGKLLYWASSCVSFGIQKDGSERNDIDATLFEEIAQQGFDTWLAAPCEDGTPGISVQSVGTVACDQAEYNQSGGNANIFLFRDQIWPYVGGADALGLSTINYDPSSGRIYDVDVEINGTDTPITTGDPVRGADLLSIVTHEEGHFFGLSHSEVALATMRPGYRPPDDSLRTLHDDDIAAICEAYPPDRDAETDSCTPRHGFSDQCGGDEEGCCTLSPGAPDQRRGPLALGALLGALLLFRARRLRRSARAPGA